MKTGGVLGGGCRKKIGWFLIRHAEFGKYVAECAVKIRDITDIENVNKLFDEQIFIFESMK